MKTSKKILAILLVMSLVLALAACGSGDSSSAGSTGGNTSSAADSSGTDSSVSGSEDGEEAEDTNTGTTPRNETLYYGGEAWNKPVNMNPLSTTSNFFMMEQDEQATVLVYETLYMFNVLDGKAYPLLADGDYEWNADRTEITFKLKEAAAWDDGTPFTADDVVATWDAHVKYESGFAADYAQYIDAFEALDEHTVVMKGKPADDPMYNPFKMEEYLTKMYMMQKAYLEKLDAELGGDSGEMKNTEMWDAPLTGAYRPTTYDSEQRIVMTRIDTYWGQDPSMWGKLPVPKYVVHNIYKDNASAQRAFEAGEIDINQSYIMDIASLWEDKGLPISTYIDEPPYQLGGTLPSLVLNTQRQGLDQKTVREAIAMAIDYDQVVSSAMTGQSYTFEELPRTLFNPTESEQSLIKDPEVLKPYQLPGNDIEGANALLDEAGIVDTDGDGIREYPAGNNLVFKAECPDGWSDWQAAINIAAAAGQEIGISIEAFFPDQVTYTEDVQTGNFDIAMASYTGAAISAPWLRAYQTMYGFGGNFPDTATFNYGRFYNEKADELLNALVKETDEDAIKDMWEQLNIIYLDEVPAISVMYRPVNFHETNETVWTNFPQADDGTNIPPMILYDGYGYAGMFNLELVDG